MLAELTRALIIFRDWLYVPARIRDYPIYMSDIPLGLGAKCLTPLTNYTVRFGPNLDADSDVVALSMECS